jgi:Putative peptidoglycan binding domain
MVRSAPTTVTRSTPTNRTVIVRNRPFRDRFIFVNSFGFGHPSWGWGWGWPYSYYGYYPYGYGYGYSPYAYNYYPYSYGYYSRPVYGAHSANSSVVVRVQERLARAGYYHSAIDGVAGPRTRSAIRAYERAHGLRVDGVISDQLLATMGLRY